MSGAADKYAGSVVGMHHGFLPAAAGQQPALSSADVALGASVEETLVVGSGVLVAALDRDGEIVWRRHPDAAATKDSVLCRSQMASMLRDTDRNSAYASAIGRCVAGVAASLGRPPHVLDIGAGTGLLTMLAARAGAASVTGIEQWDAMASVARRVVACNPSVSPAVRLLCGHSTAVRVSSATLPLPADIALPLPADIVVSEILDSALLGEGVIPALRDGYARLLRPGAGAAYVRAVASGPPTPPTPPCIPVRATVYAQLVHSSTAGRWQDTSACTLREGGGEGASHHRLSMALRPGCEALHPAIPVHAARLLATGDLTPLSHPFPALHVDFTPAGHFFRHAVAGGAGASASAGEEEEAGGGIVEGVHAVPALDTPHGQPATAVLFWWDVVLAEGVEGGAPVTYTTSPYIAEGVQGWQDHWVQCIQPLPLPVHAPAGGGYTVVACHNDSRIWFYTGRGAATVWTSKRAHKVRERQAKAALVAAAGGGGPATAIAQAEVIGLTGGSHLYTEPQPCTCGLHACTSVDRRWVLSDATRMAAYRTAVDWAVEDVVEAKRRCAAELAAAAAEVMEGDHGGRAETSKEVTTVRVLDISDGGVCALLATTCPSATAGGAHVFALIPRSTPTVVREEGDEARRRAEGGEEEVDAEEPSFDPMRVHVESMSRAATGGGAGRRVVFLDAPPHACTPALLGALLSEAMQEDAGDEDDEGDGDVEEAAAEGVGEAVADLPAPAPVLIDVLLGEPYFSQTASSALWTAAAWWARVQAAVCAGCCAAPCLVSPSSFTIYARPVVFRDLHTSFAPTDADRPGHDVCGFDHTPFNAVQSGYHAHDFNLPLWQYEYLPACAPIRVLSVDVRCGLPVQGGGRGGGDAWPRVDDQLRLGASAVDVVHGVERIPGRQCSGCVSLSLPPTTQAALPAPVPTQLARLPNAVIYWVQYDLTPREVTGSAGTTATRARTDGSQFTSNAPTHGEGDTNAPGPHRQTVRFLPLGKLLALSAAADGAGHSLAVGVFYDHATGAFQTYADLQ